MHTCNYDPEYMKALAFPLTDFQSAIWPRLQGPEQHGLQTG